MKKLLLLSALFSTTISFGIAQTGGGHVYEFLNLVSSPRMAGLGGGAIAIKDNDLNLALSNPSLLTRETSNKLTLNYVNYLSDINYGFVAYCKNFGKYGTFDGGIQYINYGDFIRAEDNGDQTGEFSAAEYAFNVGWSMAFDSVYSIGINYKNILSSFDTYRSYGMAFDIGGNFQSKTKRFVAAMLIRNIGFQVKPFESKNREELPFDVMLGVSQKLEHAPFRFSFTAHSLHKFDLTAENPDNPTPIIDPITGEIFKTKNNIPDKLMRHVIVGLEFLLTKNFHIQGGFNYQKRKEMALEEKKGLAGFSFGVGFKVSKFYLNYARSAYHLAGASNHFSITTNLSSYRKKSTPS